MRAMWAVTLAIACAGREAAGQDCGTKLTVQDVARARALEQRGAYVLPGGVAGGLSAVIVPITFHIVRTSAGTGGLPEGTLLQMLADANEGYAPLGIEFCAPLPTIFIDSDFFYFQIDTQFEIDSLRQSFVVPDTINVYCTENLALPGVGLCGISSFSFHDVQGIVMRNSCTAVSGNSSTFVHELGHYFDLYHTHETSFGLECTSGINCATAGDLLCDTPADPELGSSTVDARCVYVGTAPAPCPLNMAAYSPDTSNFMSYAPHACRDSFSPLQQEKAVATLLNLRPELVNDRCPLPATDPTPGLSRVSVSSDGDECDNFSGDPAISGNGRFVAFTSGGTNLVPGPSNFWADVYVHDRFTGQTTRISVSSRGEEGDRTSGSPSISFDGRMVAFVSEANNLGPDTNFFQDVYVRDRQTGQTTLVSVNMAGVAGNNDSRDASISADGRYVAFSSAASDLVPGDTSDRDVFVRDLMRGTTIKITEPFPGASGDASGEMPSISGDGRFVAFLSSSPNIVPGDPMGFSNVFVRDRLRGITIHASRTSTGGFPNWHCETPDMSADGRFVAFATAAPNMTELDQPGFITDVFVYGMEDHSLELASVDSAGVVSTGHSESPSLSSDGRFVAFESFGNLAPGQAAAHPDVFRHDRQTGQTVLLNPGLAGEPANGESRFAALSANGAVAAFESVASNLVPHDLNFITDVFVYELVPPPPVLPADLNHDGVVNTLDLGILLSTWTIPPSTSCAPPCPADINDDGVVNSLDLGILLSSWTL